MKVEVNRQWVQRRRCQHDLSDTFYHPRRAKIKTVRLYLETAPRMKYLFPLLAAALIPARGQIFRLPNTSACQKSKRRSKFFFIETTVTTVAQWSVKFKQTFELFRDCAREQIWQIVSLLLAGRGPGHQAGLGGGKELLQGVLHGLHQHRNQGWEWLGQAGAEGAGGGLHLDRGQEVQLQGLEYFCLTWWDEPELYKGCDREDLQPAIENGWYWAGTGKRIPAPRWWYLSSASFRQYSFPRRCGFCEWSKTGAIGESQPDNREQRQGGSDEACIGVLNNFYKVTALSSSHFLQGDGHVISIFSVRQMYHFLSARQKINLLSRFWYLRCLDVEDAE